MEVIFVIVILGKGYLIVKARVLLNILPCNVQPPKIKNYLTQNAKSAAIETPGLTKELLSCRDVRRSTLVVQTV
jgi:hypothetical protein